MKWEPFKEFKGKELVRFATKKAEALDMIGSGQTVGLGKADISTALKGCNMFAFMEFKFEDMKKELEDSPLTPKGINKQIKSVAIHIKGGEGLSTEQCMEIVESISNIVPKASVFWGATAKGKDKVTVAAILGAYDKSLRP